MSGVDTNHGMKYYSHLLFPMMLQVLADATTRPSFPQQGIKYVGLSIICQYSFPVFHN
jgi:hypothetical protein